MCDHFAKAGEGSAGPNGPNGRSDTRVFGQNADNATPEVDKVGAITVRGDVPGCAAGALGEIGR